MNEHFFAHSTADIENGAEIGEGTKIWRFSCVRKHAKVGRGCTIGMNVYIDNNVVIGNGVKIQNNVSVYDGVILEDYVFVGPSAVFTNVINPRAHIERKHEFRPTVVKRGVTIGANATIVCGIVIGEFAFIGAGAVVRHDVPDFALIVGVPGRRVGWMCQCGNRLAIGTEHSGDCPFCGAVYEACDPTHLKLVSPPNIPSLDFPH